MTLTPAQRQTASWLAIAAVALAALWALAPVLMPFVLGAGLVLWPVAGLLAGGKPAQRAWSLRGGARTAALLGLAALALAAGSAHAGHALQYEFWPEVDAYVADPWCGWDVPPDVIPSLFAPAPRLADPAQLACIRSDLPILIASGDADPLAAGGVLLEQLGQRYRDAGVADVGAGRRRRRIMAPECELQSVVSPECM